MADPKWTKYESTDIEDAEEVDRLRSMKPQMPQQRHCNCVHDALPHTPGARPSRNLVVCIDGTANQFSDKNTNVVELYSRLEKSEHLQVTFYNSGIGTYASPSWKSLTYYRQVIYHKIDLAVAWRFEKILLSAYRWLCEQYQTGDRIFLFGFSRGAYQVRALSAMIEKVGLIHRGNEAQIPFAYDLYQQAEEHITRQGDTGAGASSEAETQAPQVNNDDEDEDDAARFKRTFCREDVKVHFVGVWDTVSSVGFAMKKELPLTTEGMRHVCIFRHALALDKRRVKFLPEYANGGVGPKVDDENKSASDMPHTKEVWFSGTHSDIGGGNVKNKALNNNGPALRWMTAEASKAGLLLTPFSWRWDAIRRERAFKKPNSLVGFWRVLEILPIKRHSYKDDHGITRRPHLGRRRKIVEGQLVHRSVYGLDRLHHTYRDDLKEWNGRDPSKIEPDRLDQATHHIDDAIDILSNMEIGASARRRHHLLHLEHTSDMFGTDEAVQAYINLSHVLYYPTDLNDLDARRRTVAIMEVLQTLAYDLFQKQHFSRQPPVVRDLLRRDALQQDIMEIEIINVFLKAFGTAEIFSIRRNGPVSSFAFSPDNKQIACGTAAGNIFFRDAKTGAAVQSKWKTTVLRHSARVSCLAFSQDGNKIASGDHDDSVKLWDAESGDPLYWFWRPEFGNISSVSFAWDGRLAVTSAANVIDVFDSKFKSVKRFDSHGYDVISAMFSPKPQSSTTFGMKNGSNTPSDLSQAAYEPNSAHCTSDQPVITLSASGGPDTSSRNQPTTIPNPISDTGANQHNDVNLGVVDHPPHSPTSGGVDQSVKGSSLDLKPSSRDRIVKTFAKFVGTVRRPHERTHIVTVSRDRTFRVWDVDAVAKSPVFGQPMSEEHTDRMLPVEVVKKPSFKSPLQEDEMRCVAFSNDGSKVFVGSRDGSVSMWNFNSGPSTQGCSWLASESKPIHSARPGGKRFAVNSLAVAPSLPSSSPQSSSLTPSSSPTTEIKLACGLDDGRVTLWDLSSGKPRFEREFEHLSSVMSVSYSPDGKRIAACTEQGIVVVWDVNGSTGECILEQMRNNDSWFPNHSKKRKPAKNEKRK